MAPELVEVMRSDPFLAAFPDVEIVSEDTLVDGDKVVDSWVDVATHTGVCAGIAPTGRRVRLSGISIVRIEHGKVVETWIMSDELDLLRQLGVERMPK